MFVFKILNITTLFLKAKMFVPMGLFDTDSVKGNSGWIFDPDTKEYHVVSDDQYYAIEAYYNYRIEQTKLTSADLEITCIEQNENNTLICPIEYAFAAGEPVNRFVVHPAVINRVPEISDHMWDLLRETRAVFRNLVDFVWHRLHYEDQEQERYFQEVFEECYTYIDYNYNPQEFNRHHDQLMNVIRVYHEFKEFHLRNQ